MLSRTKIISLTANIEMAQQIADIIGVDVLKTKVIHFSDGEVLFEGQESMRGENIYIVQSTCDPVTERLMELLLCIDACKRASAKSVTCVIPYFGYARQDRMAKPRQPISARLVADLITVAGADRVICSDLHASQVQGFFKIPVDEISPLPIIYKYFRDLKLDNCVCVAPDHGGAIRASHLANMLNVPVAIIDKRRPNPNQAEIIGLVGDVKDKECILIDDIVDTAGTLCLAANKLKELGAKKVYASITHPILSNDAVDKINASAIDELITTDTIVIPPEKMSPKFKVLSLAPLYAAIIGAISEGKSITNLYEKFIKKQIGE